MSGPGDAGLPRALKALLDSIAKATELVRRHGEYLSRVAQPPEPELLLDPTEYEIGIVAAGVAEALEQHGQPSKLPV
jgi:hypothetical protein